MPTEINWIAGWDIGGAHLKCVTVSLEGQVEHVQHLACPLWRGLHTFERSLQQALRELPEDRVRHAVTMTGELSDIFADRVTGVRALATSFVDQATGPVEFYAGPAGFVSKDDVSDHDKQIASANWHASGRFVSSKYPNALFVDIGSTTTDILCLRDGTLDYLGYHDHQRLQTQELLYTGVIRTPIMAVVDKIPFSGQWHFVTAEVFATLADVFVLTADLPKYPTWSETADGAGKEPLDCARRLARMLGMDIHPGQITAWRHAAQFIAGRQLDSLRLALERLLSRHHDLQNITVIGAGIGRFQVRRVADLLGLSYTDFSELLRASQTLRESAAVCAPATALAQLAQLAQQAQTNSSRTL